MTSLSEDFYPAAAALTNLGSRRWVLGAGYRLQEYVASGYSIAQARAFVLAVPQYANGLSAAGLATAFNNVTNTTLGGGNLVPNPSFEVDTGGWTTSLSVGVTGGAISRVTSWSSSGSASMQVTGTNAADTTTRRIGAQTATGTSGMPVAPGRAYSASADLNISDAASNGFRCTILWWRSDGTASVTQAQINGPLSLAGATGPQTISFTATAPDDAAFATLRVAGEVNTSLDATTYQVDAVSFVPA
jgi:hypothetical protein